MKKALGVALIAALVLGVSSAALARWGGPGMGMGMGMGMGYGPQRAMMGSGMGPGMGFGPGAGPCWRQGATGVSATAIDETKAKELATDYVTKNLPGYKIEKLEKFQRPRGTMYSVELKGPKDEVRYIHINFFGMVMPFGPGRTF